MVPYSWANMEERCRNADNQDVGNIAVHPQYPHQCDGDERNDQKTEQANQIHRAVFDDVEQIALCEIDAENNHGKRRIQVAQKSNRFIQNGREICRCQENCQSDEKANGSGIQQDFLPAQTNFAAIARARQQPDAKRPNDDVGGNDIDGTDKYAVISV